MNSFELSVTLAQASSHPHGGSLESTTQTTTPFDFSSGWLPRPSTQAQVELSTDVEMSDYIPETNSTPMSPAPAVTPITGDDMPIFEEKINMSIELVHDFKSTSTPVTPVTQNDDGQEFFEDLPPIQPTLERENSLNLPGSKNYTFGVHQMPAYFEEEPTLNREQKTQQVLVQREHRVQKEIEIRPQVLVQRETITRKETVVRREPVPAETANARRPAVGKRGRPVSDTATTRKAKTQKTRASSDGGDPSGKAIVCLLARHGKCNGKVSKTPYQHEKHLRDVHQGGKKYYHCFFCQSSFRGKEHTRRHLKEHCKAPILTNIRLKLMMQNPNVDLGTSREWDLIGKDGKSKTHKFEYVVTQGARCKDVSKQVKGWVISKETIMDFVVYKCTACNTTCDSEESLGNHTAAKHEICECCGQWVLPGMFYNRHKSKEFRHHKLFLRCGECKEIFLRTRQIEGKFMDHQREMHGDASARFGRRRRC